ncbi:MAG: elongation factor P hydroxylase [Verrucomicrobia bacterium]|nr:elongation factor P hydroxylase [Verrucomicrobiota bacterium]
MGLMHQYQDLIAIFNQCFEKEYNTQLIKGGDEPIYLPADADRPYHALYFARGFFSSALHESAHWLIAGEKRRLQVDFGYWYVPDGRSNEEQTRFESVEIKPQALEWILSKAAGYPFRLSLDNLNGNAPDSRAFVEAVHNQVKIYCGQGLSVRASTFRSALCLFYKTPIDLDITDFDLDSI